MLLDKIYEEITPITDDLGYILWGIEILGEGKGLTLRVYIDSENGISADDCQKVSKNIGYVFDVESLIEDKYTLEVSSPGMNRLVFSPIQAKALIGFVVKVVLNEKMDGSYKFKGTLESVDENDNITLVKDDSKSVIFNFTDLKKMRVSPQF